MKYTYLLIIFFILSACTDYKGKENQSEKTLISVGKNPDALFLTPNKQKIYVANSGDSFISVINTKTDKVVKKIKGPEGAWGFHPIPNTNLVALSTYSGQIVLIDFEKDKISQQKKFDYKFGDITVGLDGKNIYIIAIEQKKVLKIDVSDWSIIDSYETGGDPDGIDISKDGVKLFVTNREDGTISMINIVENKTRLIKTGGKPELINSNEDNSLIYASNFDLNTMHIIDSETGDILHDISDLDGPEGAHFDENNRKFYISNYNSNEVYEYKEGDYSTIANTFSVGKNPLSMVSLENKLYVSNYSDHSISVIHR